MEERNEIVRWYAVKVFFNRMSPLREQLILDRVNFFVPDAIKSLLFIQVSDSYLASFESSNYSRVWIYRNLLTGKPSAIPDREMELFIFVCTAGERGLSYLGEDRPEYHQGDRVRVIEGPLKGAEGYIKRIKKDRRLVVSVRGVVAVATMHIPPEFIETITE
ncbi:MAG: transcriptional regulator [Bacteroidales bacterium]|nr:transcriptional regulator [Bacteroidales bacterium]